jgi:ACS family hexuronate transporter-like MFS transporter
LDARETIADEVPRSAKAGPAWGWGLCWLLFASTTLSYMDRQAVSVVGERLTAEFGGSVGSLGWIIAAFGIPYALFQIPAGFLADRGDVRRTYAAAVVAWSMAAMAVAWSPTLGALMAFRAMLGVGESFNWPCALRVTATVLPPADRSLGNGIFNSGAAVGAVLTPLIVAPLTAWLGWRAAFALIGGLGFIWAVAWWVASYGPAAGLFLGADRARPSGRIPAPALAAFATLAALSVGLGAFGYGYRATTPVRMSGGAGTFYFFLRSPTSAVGVGVGDTIGILAPDGGGTTPLRAGAAGTVVERVRAGEPIRPGDVIAEIRGAPLGLTAIWWAVVLLMVGLILGPAVLPASWLGRDNAAAALGEVVRLRRFWVLVVVSVSINVCWHFLVNWLPTYLRTDRGMAFVAGSMLSALPFLAADAGNLGGGAASRWLARRGLPASRARAVVMVGCVLLIAPGAAVGAVGNNALIVALLAAMALGTAAFMANYFAFCQEVDPSRTGLVVGILGALGNLFAAGFAPVVGWVKDTTGGFGPVFLVVGLLPFVGLAALLIGWGRDDPKPAAPDLAEL